MVTQLLYNYRSLPTILASYNELFYDGILVPNVSPDNSKESKILAKVQEQQTFEQKYRQNYGIYFIGVKGNEERTTDSSSWRNPQETWKVN